MTPVQKAIDHLGGVKKAAEIMGFNPGYMSQVNTGHRACGAELAWKFEFHTRGAVTREQLRPDIFGPMPHPWGE